MPHRPNVYVKDFESANAYLDGKVCRKLGTGRSTTLRRCDEHTIAVYYHSTAVVIFHDGGTTELNAGGWFSVTTKERINQFSRARVYQEKHEWYVVSPHAHGGRVQFFSHMRINSATGHPTEDVEVPVSEPVEPERPRKDPPERPDAYWKVN